MKILALVLMIVAAFGPFECGRERDEARDRAKLAEMEAQIDAMIGDARCADSGQCKLIAFGAKPCGGPWKYKIYSEAVVSTEKLTKYVNAYNAYNRELNETYGWASDCGVASPPAVECRDGKCQAVAAP